MTTTFTANSSPFPSWRGPYSVARGTKAGFRFKLDRLGVGVETSSGLSEVWTAARSPGVTSLELLVRQHWGGGRLLLLPDGHVVKPDPDEPCTRYLIGRIRGPLVLETPNGKQCDLSRAQHLHPGEPWPGPPGTGIECKIDSTGCLDSEWELIAPGGRLVQTHRMWGPDPVMATGLRSARPALTSARVRVEIGGAVVTMREDEESDDPRWTPRFVGRVDVRRWPFDENWVID